jgi:UDP-glucose 4-epimerase
MRVLVTGGTGYIGSHTCLSLIAAGHSLVALDNLCNSSSESLNRIAALTGVQIPFVNADVRHEAAVLAALNNHRIDAVIHFAGLKSVAESVAHPARYFDNNVEGTACVARAMQRAGVEQLVFSSSASVYGLGSSGCVAEDAPTAPANAYAESKLRAEAELTRAAQGSAMRVALLRYFNPVGAHESGTMGEDPAGLPNNLMPYVCQVAVGRLPKLRVFGNDYPTPDGTGVRDYIHVMDLAEGHVAALDHLEMRAPGSAFMCNLGSGQGHSVLDVIHTFERVNSITIPYEIVARRAGDVASYYADPTLATRVLKWRTQRSLADMCRDAWHWQKQNPQGYR